MDDIDVSRIAFDAACELAESQQAELTRLRAEVESEKATSKILLDSYADENGRISAERDALKAEVEALRSLVGELATYDHYSTEYDGRVIVLCPDCGEQDGIHTAGCAFVRAKAQIDAARAAQGDKP